MADNILEMDLTKENEELLRESLESWKEDVYSSLLEEVEVLKEQKIEELEEANIAYREELKEEYANKMINALKEMREEIKAEVLAETVASNPELQVFEQIKELIAPTLNEDFVGNVYAEELQTLREKVLELQEEAKLEEGAKTLAELIAPYSEQTQDILLAVIKEGGPEEVTEQFYELIESLELSEAEKKDKDDDEDEEDDEEDDEDEEGEDDEDEDEEDKEDDEDEDEEDEEENEDFESYTGSYISESEKGRDQTTKKNAFVSRVLELAE